MKVCSWNPNLKKSGVWTGNPKKKKVKVCEEKIQIIKCFFLKCTTNRNPIYVYYKQKPHKLDQHINLKKKGGMWIGNP